MEPIFIIIGANLLFREKLNKNQLLFARVILVGIFILLFDDNITVTSFSMNTFYAISQHYHLLSEY
ncbi:MAG: hypothetical protein LBU27_05735 [Candidatus Peribacteria bacterium]|nr:hypothetical protein [Candidatus Peribacteria bacterium]